MEFEVLEPGRVLIPNYHFINEKGICVFVVSDRDPAWYNKPRQLGLYKSTVWVPGNFLSEGTLLIGAAITTPEPLHIHFYERDVVAFQVIDSLDGDSARGVWAGPLPGVVRPILEWTTQYTPSMAGEEAEALSERV
jgi:lipopolysaccharide transport system ATP-binding protein